MTDAKKLFNDTMELLTDLIIPEGYEIVARSENSTEYSKLERLTHLIMNAKKIKNPLPCFGLYDVVVLPFKDMKIEFCKENNSFFACFLYDVIDEITCPKDVFKYIYISIHLKLMEKYDSRTITCIILDVMIYCIINKIEINILSLINVNYQLNDKSEYNYKWGNTKKIFKEAIPDGYMKDIILKAIKQEQWNEEIEYTYSIVDIVNQLKIIY